MHSAFTNALAVAAYDMVLLCLHVIRIRIESSFGSLHKFCAPAASPFSSSQSPSASHTLVHPHPLFPHSNSPAQQRPWLLSSSPHPAAPMSTAGVHSPWQAVQSTQSMQSMWSAQGEGSDPDVVWLLDGRQGVCLPSHYILHALQVSGGER